MLNARKQAGKQIGEAVKGFKGKQVSYDGVVDEFRNGLEEVKIVLTPDGELDFSQLNNLSTLNEPSVKKTLSDTLSDLRTIKDAEGLHQLKRDIDKRVSYVQRLDGGTDSDAEELLKTIRRSINESLGKEFPDYAKANQVFSESSTALENLVKAVPKSKDLKFDTPEQVKKSSKFLGQQLKKIQTNYSSKEDLNASILEMDALSKNTAVILKMIYLS